MKWFREWLKRRLEQRCSEGEVLEEVENEFGETLLVIPRERVVELVGCEDD